MLYCTYGVILNPGKLSAKYLAEHDYFVEIHEKITIEELINH